MLFTFFKHVLIIVEFAMVNLDRSNPIFSGLLRDYLKINERALKNYFSLSDYTDFKKMIPKIFLY